MALFMIKSLGSESILLAARLNLKTLFNMKKKISMLFFLVALFVTASATVPEVYEVNEIKFWPITFLLLFILVIVTIIIWLLKKTKKP